MEGFVLVPNYLQEQRQSVFYIGGQTKRIVPMNWVRMVMPERTPGCPYSLNMNTDGHGLMYRRNYV